MFGRYITNCEDVEFCSFSGTWALDLDEHPELIGQPLDVEIQVYGPAGSYVGGTAITRMERK